MPTYEYVCKSCGHLFEIVQSMRIVEQALAKLPDGPVITADKRVALPEKERVYNTIEALMNHFVIIYDGIKVPRNECYVATEGGNGELGFYVISDGSERPYRVRCRPPCLPPVAALHRMIEGEQIADLIPTFGSVNMIGGELDR